MRVKKAKIYWMNQIYYKMNKTANIFIDSIQLDNGQY